MTKVSHHWTNAFRVDFTNANFTLIGDYHPVKSIAKIFKISVNWHRWNPPLVAQWGVPLNDEDESLY